jgi:hypothetical protein
MSGTSAKGLDRLWEQPGLLVKLLKDILAHIPHGHLAIFTEFGHLQQGPHDAMHASVRCQVCSACCQMFSS